MHRNLAESFPNKLRSDPPAGWTRRLQSNIVNPPMATMQNPWCFWDPVSTSCSADNNTFYAYALTLPTNSIIRAFVRAEFGCQSYTTQANCVAASQASNCRWTGSSCDTMNAASFASAAVGGIFQENSASCGWVGNLLSAPYCSAFSLTQCSTVLGCMLTAKTTVVGGQCANSNTCDTDPSYLTSLMCGRQMSYDQQAALVQCTKVLTVNATVAAMGGTSYTYDSTCFDKICPAYGQYMTAIVPATVSCSLVTQQGLCSSKPLCQWNAGSATQCGIKVSSVWSASIPSTCPLKSLYTQSITCEAQLTPSGCSGTAGLCAWRPSTACLNQVFPVDTSTCEVSMTWLGHLFAQVAKSVDTQFLASLVISQGVCPNFNNMACLQNMVQGIFLPAPAPPPIINVGAAPQPSTSVAPALGQIGISASAASYLSPTKLLAVLSVIKISRLM